MPCLVGPDDFERWLGPGPSDAAALSRILDPPSPGTLITERVSTRVNNVKNEGPSLLQPDTLF